MLNAIIAILAEKGILEDEEAKELVEKLKVSTLPGDWTSSRALIHKIFAAIEKDKRFL